MLNGMYQYRGVDLLSLRLVDMLDTIFYQLRSNTPKDKWMMVEAQLTEALPDEEMTDTIDEDTEFFNKMIAGR